MTTPHPLPRQEIPMAVSSVKALGSRLTRPFWWMFNSFHFVLP